MQVILSQDEIISALEQYVRSQISIKTGQTIVIDLKAGRGENGFSANLDIRQTAADTPVYTREAATPRSNESNLTIDGSKFKLPSAEVLPMTAEDKQEVSGLQEATATKNPSSIFSFSKTANE